jgi:hypothetical protein
VVSGGAISMAGGSLTSLALLLNAVDCEIAFLLSGERAAVFAANGAGASAQRGTFRAALCLDYGFGCSPAGGTIFTSDSVSVRTRPSGLTSRILSDATS